MHTYRLDKETSLLHLERGAFGSQYKAGMVGYIPLPVRADAEDKKRTRWRLLLELTGSNHGLLAFEILDDVIFGRDYKGQNPPDVDMTILDAHNLGVSRQHSMFRPTENHLYLIDLGSTNGTFVNGYPIGKGRAHALAEGDHLSLAKLNMSVAQLVKVPGALPAPDTDDLTAPPSKPDKPKGKPTDRLEG